MSSYLFPTRLDRWVLILGSLQVNQWQTLSLCKSGGGHLRIKELIQAGLIVVQTGRNGGYQLALPLSEIPFSALLDIFPREKCPTLNLLYRFGHVSVQEIIAWPEAPRGKYKASIESVVNILLRLDPIFPVLPEEMSDLPYSVGYIEQVVASFVPYRLATNCHRKGKILVKPFEEITIGDIAPILAHRGNIHSTIISKSTDVKLVDIIKGWENG